MKQFSYRLLLALFILFSGSACGADSGHADGEPGSQVGDESGMPSGKSDWMGGAPQVEGVPTQITTASTEFEGVLPAYGTLNLQLTAQEDDTIVMWLRVEGSAMWSPELSIYRSGNSRALVYSKPGYGNDAHLPYNEYQLEDGWEFYQGGEHRVELVNRSGVEGQFKFTLECLEGPCENADPGSTHDAGTNHDTGGNHDAGTNHDTGNVGGGDSPYADLSNSALRRALKATHTSDHHSLGYNRARDFMFEYDMENVGADGEVECIYSGRKAFINGRIDAQRNHNYNTEHTWPQSRGATGTAKSDLHHLFVIDAPINSRRANYFFDYVVDIDYQEGGSKLGQNAAGQTRFEVRPETRGNVARAIFYFAVVYDKDITADEEAALRQWHIEDPVDAAERARNHAVEDVQGNRNFFIDYPELVEQIADF